VLKGRTARLLLTLRRPLETYERGEQVLYRIPSPLSRSPGVGIFGQWLCLQ